MTSSKVEGMCIDCMVLVSDWLAVASLVWARGLKALCSGAAVLG